MANTISNTEPEVKEAQLLFNSVWTELEQSHTKNHLRFPREIIWLGGAPGAGKGTNTPFIMKMRDITAPPIVISDLLTSPSAKKIKDAGGLVGDREVIHLLLAKLLEPEFRNGVIVDGFPRTQVQVEVLKLFHDKSVELHHEHLGTPDEVHFRKPLYHIVLLFVDEEESVARQLHRGREILIFNRQVEANGIGEKIEERATDVSADAARKRFRVFKDTTFNALHSLRHFFHYHFIDAKAPLKAVQERILEEFAYQSSLELESASHERIRRIPLATDLVKHARQELVRRINSYEKNQSKLFEKVIQSIELNFIPIVAKHSMTGWAFINSEDTLFSDPVALEMLIDVFSERGYYATVDIRKNDLPVRLENQQIITERKKVYRFQIRFQGYSLQRA